MIYCWILRFWSSKQLKLDGIQLYWLLCVFLEYLASFQGHLNQSYLFTDCDIVGKVSGVCFTYSKEGRPSGEAFIELKTAEDFKNALAKDRKYMGHRYIEGKKYKQS